MDEESRREKQKQLESCSVEWWKIELRDMIESVWCYNNYDNIEDYLQNRYIMNYTEYGLTEEEIKDITIDQVNYLNKYYEIKHNVYTDSDGLTYNSVVKKEDI